MINFLPHFFWPRESNNYRAKLLHHNVLFLLIAFIFTSSFLFEVFKVNFPSILGIQTNITVEQLLNLTNEKRKEFGLSPLTLNPQLTNAAALKAQDMFEKDYWAHNSPDGKTPWVFIREAGYSYTYAGENLAKGFVNTEDVVNAWMASPKHRDNLLFQNYSDVGFSVATGKLNGQDTILVVQEFGNQGTRAIASNDLETQNETVQEPASEELESEEQKNEPSSEFASLTNSPGGNTEPPSAFAGASTDQKPFLNSLTFSLNFDRALLILFISLLVLDMVIVERRRIIRLVGHNTDHILFLILVAMIVTFFSKGFIL